MPVEYKNNLLQLQRKIDAAMNRGLLSAGKEVVALASVLAPKDSGELSRSGKAETIGNGEVEVSFGNDIKDIRAIVQEYGGIFTPARPYLFPALRTVNIEFFIRDALQDAFR